MIDFGKKNVLGVSIAAVDYEMTVESIIKDARERCSMGVTAVAMHGVMTGFKDKEHRYRLNHLDMVVPDGQPVRWALNILHGARLQDRVYGPTLMLKVCERAASEGPADLFVRQRGACTITPGMQSYKAVPNAARGWLSAV